MYHIFKENMDKNGVIHYELLCSDLSKYEVIKVARNLKCSGQIIRQYDKPLRFETCRYFNEYGEISKKPVKNKFYEMLKRKLLNGEQVVLSGKHMKPFTEWIRKRIDFQGITIVPNSCETSKNEGCLMQLKDSQ